MIDLLRLLRNEKVIAETLQSLPPLRSPVMDTVYPADTKRRQHMLAQIAIDEIEDTVQTVPLVRRGAPGVPAGQETGLLMYIEPQPIRIEDSIGAKEANDIQALGRDWNQYLASKLERIRRKIRATTEALAAQSLTGQIRYPLLLENGQYTTYEVDFTRGGANPVATYTPEKLWDNSTATLKDVLMDLTGMVRVIQDNGWGTNVRFWAGKAAYAAILNLALSARAERKVDVTFTGASANIAGFTVELMNSTYQDPQTKLKVNVVDDNDIIAFDLDAPFTLFYLAIDHFKAGLKPMPIFVYPYERESGDSLRIFAESKPLPCPVVKAICRATVVS